MINASFLDDLSLYHGKMGIVLFFYCYAHYVNNPIYEEFAEELLDEVVYEIHDHLSVNFENGLSGIGWGILYLLRKGFIAGNPEEILEDVDHRMMEMNLLKVRDVSLEKGLRGLAVYLSLRLSFCNAISNFDSDFISDLQKVIICKKIETEFDLNEIFNLPTTFPLNEFADISLGVYKGCAGFGFKIMTI